MRRLLVVLVIATSFAGTRAHGQRGERAERAERHVAREAPRVSRDERAVLRGLSRAEEALRRQRTERALTLLEALAHRVPRDARAASRFCAIAIPETDPTVVAHGERSASIARDAARCIALIEGLEAPADPLDAEIAGTLAWARALLGDRAPALARMTSRPLDERDVGALRRLATLAVDDGALEDAVLALSLARRVRPHDLELLGDLAAIELARGNAAAAVTAFRTIVAARPGDPDAIRDLAGACLQAGDDATAVRYLEQLARDEPDRARSWLDLARARIELGELDGAARDGRRALALVEAGDPSASLVLGEALRLAGDLEGARASYEEALRRDPSSALARRALDALREDR